MQAHETTKAVAMLLPDVVDSLVPSGHQQSLTESLPLSPVVRGRNVTEMIGTLLVGDPPVQLVAPVAVVGQDHGAQVEQIHPE